MKINRFYLMFATAILVSFPSFSRGITLGQIDTFEDDTKQGWNNGSAIGVQPGGPAGSNDHYLPHLAGGSGLPSLWQMTNTSQWLGNYRAAGVTGIEMDLRAEPAYASQLMNLRIAIRESPSANMNAGYVSTAPFIFPMNQQWYHVSFSLLPDSLTPIGSPQPLAIDLANVADFRILSARSPATQGDQGAGASGFGVDNIRAVPEPSTICLAMSATIGLILFRRRVCQEVNNSRSRLKSRRHNEPPVGYNADHAISIFHNHDFHKQPLFHTVNGTPMRLHAVIAITSIIALPINADSAFAQFNYSSQNRSISANAHRFSGIGSIDDVKSATAPDFNDFIKSLTATATIGNGTATSSASQNSQLAMTTIMASGSVSSKGYRANGVDVGFADSESSFSTTFVLIAPAGVQVTAQLMAHRGVMTNFSDTIGSSFFSLVGGPTMLTTMTTIPDLQSDSSVVFSQALSLSAGSYVVTASARSTSGTPNLTNVVNGSNLTSNASYSMSINIVPEPSSMALAAIGVLGLVAAYLGRIRLAFQRSSLTP